MKQLDPDCPICAMLARQGAEVLTLDGDSDELIAAGIPDLAVGSVMLTVDPAVAPLLAGLPGELPLPAAVPAALFIEAVCFTAPDLFGVYPPGALELHRDGRRLDPMALVRDGDHLTLRAAGGRAACA
jgi:hypothetical protein